MNAPVFCTIVAHNYLAYARVLCSSLREHHADARVVVLIVDPPDRGRENGDEPFETIHASELGLARLRSPARPRS